VAFSNLICQAPDRPSRIKSQPSSTT